ncbi:hypothetical protein RMSM_05303 [Rhodopirellula maiorica SM1]|uniref:Uncharacterized protein n=1 Tax=Rhodopirellula maiorica SM1 TaxID=1265738 RepID=M5RQX7_9BACT|nr:hypothetical protein [Rhodopirellula maiorica]EMI17777.1 hypothetical protein RMSM_05303 [Rhodopirellula maiorica SM1]
MSETALMVAIVDLALEAELRHRTEQGEFIRPLAVAPLVSYSWLLSYCRERKIRSRNCHHTAESRERALIAVQDDGLPIRLAAKSAGMSKSAVHRIVMKRRKSMVDSVDEVGFETVPPYRCPEHGKTTLRPCPACAAMR